MHFCFMIGIIKITYLGITFRLNHRLWRLSNKKNTNFSRNV